MHLPEIDKYADRKSALHRLNPQVKLISFLLLIVAVLSAPTIPIGCCGLAVAVVFTVMSRIPFAFVFGYLKWVVSFVLFLMVVLALTAGGPALVALGPLALSERGCGLGLLIALRALAAVLLLFPMAGTMRFSETLRALQSLGVPNVLVQLIGFTYRYVFVMLDQLRTMLTAARSRAFRSRTDMRTMKVTSCIVGMLLVRGLKHTQDIYHAMLARGYDGTVRSLQHPRVGRADVLKGLGIVLPAAGLFAAALLT